MFENCVNNGTVEGTNAYGISNAINIANNVVSMGVVNGKNVSYSFWDGYCRPEALLYGLSDTCVNCSNDVVLFTINSDGRYQTLNNDSLVALLNVEAEKKVYELRWDENLVLSVPTITVHIGSPVNRYVKVLSGTALEDSGVQCNYHYFIKGSYPSSSNEFKRTTIINNDMDLVPYFMVTVTGEISGTFFVEANGIHYLVDAVKPLKQYLESKNYAVGDSNNNTLLDTETVVTDNMDIKVLKRNLVVIDMDETVLASDVNASIIAIEISTLTNIELSEILVEIEYDEQGHITKVIVVLSDGDTCEQVAVAINDLDKDVNCEPSVLCHSKQTRVQLAEDISLSSRISLQHSLFFLVFMFILLC